MKKLTLAIALLSFISIEVSGQNPFNFKNSSKQGDNRLVPPPKDSNSHAPIFKFKEKENTHDFGTIPEGPKVTYNFTFTNIGKSPLIISNAQASCGCTSPEFPKEPILPGKTGKISVTYTTEGHPNEFLKSVYLTSNAENPNGSQKLELYIKGKVTPKK